MTPLASRLAAPKHAPWPDRPIPVALVITDLDVGGAERALVQLATGLDPARWSLSVIALMAEGPLAGVLRDAGIPTTCLGVRRSRPRAAILALRAELARTQPRLVQSFLFHANIAARLALPRRGGPWLVGGLRVAERQRRWHLALDRLTQRRACGSVCVSEGVRRFSVATARLDPDRLTVIPNGVDLDRIDRAEPASRETLGLDPSARLVLFVGRLDPQKGLDHLAAAWDALAQSHPNAHLLLVGDGPDRPRIEAWIARRPDARVRLLGRRDDVPSLLKSADVLVLPSRWEGMPNAVLEAMAASLPVVATRVEGTEDLVVDGQTGWLVPPADPDALADALADALDNSGESRRRGAAGRVRVETHFSVAASIAAYERLWAAVLGLPDPPARP